MRKLNQKGMTLIEVLISMAILAIAVVGLLGTQTLFATQTADRALLSALVDAAASGMTQCQSRLTPSSTITVEYLTVSISTTGTCAPAAAATGNCGDVTVTASAKGKSYSITSRVCNFT